MLKEAPARSIVEQDFMVFSGSCRPTPVADVGMDIESRLRSDLARMARRQRLGCIDGAGNGGSIGTG